jgi:hypothetical protein
METYKLTVNGQPKELIVELNQMSNQTTSLVVGGSHASRTRNISIPLHHIIISVDL